MSLRERTINGGCLLLLLLVPAWGWWQDNPYLLTLTARVCILAMAGVGLNLVLGYGGLVSLGHAAFFGIGGYVAGIIASHALNYQPFFSSPFVLEGSTQLLVIWPVVAIVCALAAATIGALSLRTSGVYFIMITLAFAQMCYYFAVSWPAYGGEDGLPIYLRSHFPGLDTQSGVDFLGLCLGGLLLSLWLAARVLGSRFGMVLQAGRQNEARVAAVGISLYRIRLLAFTLSGVITGLAGSLYVELNRFVSPSMLSWHTSGEIMVFVLLGGVARLFGPLVGAAVYVTLELLLGGLTEHWQFWLGLILLLVVLFARGGLIGLLLRDRGHD